MKPICFSGRPLNQIVYPNSLRRRLPTNKSKMSLNLGGCPLTNNAIDFFDDKKRVREHAGFIASHHIWRINAPMKKARDRPTDSSCVDEHKQVEVNSSSDNREICEKIHATEEPIARADTCKMLF